MRKQLFFIALSVYSISVIGQTPDPKLNFDTNNFSLKTISFKTKILKVRAYENIVYVSNPVDTIYQKINIYIPEEYFQDKIINGYNGLYAPIFLPNQSEVISLPGQLLQKHRA